MELRINPPIGNAKYSVSFFDGCKKHKDGSPFYDLKIFNSKKDRDKFVEYMLRKGSKIN